jgi:peroxiredoxin Q/BCP
MYGKKYLGVLRTTFVIDENGIIQEVFGKVKTKDHTNQIFKSINL